MKTLQVTLWLYTTALSKSWDCLRKNWVVSFAPVVYGIILTVAGIVAAPLGIVGGLIYSLVSSACASSGLFLIKNMVESGKTDINDFLNGFLVYFGRFAHIFFHSVAAHVGGGQWPGRRAQRLVDLSVAPARFVHPAQCRS